jgi:predicted component of type VI protein secretion system
MEFEFGVGRRSRRRDEEAPMRLLLVGDFSGAPPSDRPPLASRPTLNVDVDNIENVMGQLRPRVRVGTDEIELRQIDDFHPDRLYARLTAFEPLRDARANPIAATGDLLERLLGKTPAATPAAPPPANPLDALIRSVVAPHVVKDTSAQEKVHVAAIDAAIGEQMRGVLRDPAFQALEAAWRGVRWLISNLEIDANLQVHLFDVRRDEILGDVVAAGGNLAEAGLYRALVDRSRNVPGGQGWSALVALFAFGSSDEDAALLGALGLIASQAGGPFLASAGATLPGEAASSSWQTLRRSQVARFIGLAAPRILLRRPYGKDSDPIDSFAFEELSGAPRHDEFLWGPGSLAMALLIGRSFTANGWNMEPGDEREIDDLPLVTLVRDGEREMQPCAERFLTESQIQSMLDAGLVPIASRRDRNAVVAIRFQSIADPPAALAW